MREETNRPDQKVQNLHAVLLQAIRDNNVEVVNKQLESAKSSNLLTEMMTYQDESSGNTCLHIAAGIERLAPQIVQSLLNYFPEGADYLPKNKEGKTPLELIQAHIVTIDLFLDSPRYESGFRYYYRRGQIERYESELKSTRENRTAAKDEFLIHPTRAQTRKAQEEQKRKSEEQQRAQQERAKQAQEQQEQERQKRILEDQKKYTGLIEAIEARDFSKIKEFLQNGTPVTSENSDKKSALAFAVDLESKAEDSDRKEDYGKIISLIVNNRSQEVKKEKGTCALAFMNAIQSKNKVVIRDLLAKGMTASGYCYAGKTVLHFLVEQKDVGMVKEILTAGNATNVEITSQDSKTGKTSIELAIDMAMKANELEEALDLWEIVEAITNKFPEQKKLQDQSYPAFEASIQKLYVNKVFKEIVEFKNISELSRHVFMQRQTRHLRLDVANNLIAYAKCRALFLASQQSPQLRLTQKEEKLVSHNRNWPVFTTNTKGIYNTYKSGNRQEAERRRLEKTRDVLSSLLQVSSDGVVSEKYDQITSELTKLISPAPIALAQQVSEVPRKQSLSSDQMKANQASAPEAVVPSVMHEVDKEDIKNLYLNSIGLDAAFDLVGTIRKDKRLSGQEKQALLKAVKISLLEARAASPTILNQDHEKFLREHRSSFFSWGQTTSEKILSLFSNGKNDEATKLLQQEKEKNQNEMEKLFDITVTVIQRSGNTSPKISDMGDMTSITTAAAADSQQQVKNPPAKQAENNKTPVVQRKNKSSDIAGIFFPKAPTHSPVVVASNANNKPTQVAAQLPTPAI